MSKFSISMIVLALVLGGSVVYLGSKTKRPTGELAAGISVNASDHVKGSSTAPVVLIEYSDFQCPACGYFYPILEELAARHENDMLFVYRHFPLTQIHKHAKPAAQAAEAAALQGKFWEMHNLIFDNQSAWSVLPSARETFVRYAKDLGLDLVKFQSDMDSDETAKKIDADSRGGVEAGLNSTPSFFLNGKRIQNPRSLEEFENLISAAKNASQ
ncbi:MAG: Thioredoxin domain protein [Parcubacteria group bacterium GW2011_GWB1_52_7]|nr:MAG: Thioredoxin domain protein [Parcubacteria group bacterium GW2011_GWA1_51_12]KKW28395.1 MAG: Thioredoxin domain protein [Parcubacteria group bacterium GW2011_GWB1_52_7]KKW31627.1 MAG: Thioredoxin domain protein [Parcubacteria group bacterium GW2011_GWC2_52_8c]